MLRRKHIRAPATFDPGPGHPRERLAYLNEAEMEMLRRLTDGRSDPGPKGIPSFAVTSGTTSGTTMGGNKTSSNPSGGGPGGPFGPNSGPSKSTTTSGSKSSSVTGGGGKGSSTAGAASSGSKGPVGPNGPNSGPSTGKTAGGVSAPSATSGLGGSKSPSSASPSATKTPSSPMGGQGSSFSSSAAASAYNRGVTTRSTPTPASPMGGQNATFSSPSRAAEANARTASAIKGGQNPSGSQKVASGVSQSQKDAYTQFGQKMAAAPRAPEVMRSPGDAEQLARMARAENNLIRDPVTGKMSQLAAQGTMNVIRNRMENQNFDVRGIISQDDQFSPWEDGSYAATKPSAAETAMAEQVLRGVTPDYTATPAYPQGADFYHNATTVNKNSGYTKASATTKERIKDRFEATLSVADAVKPGVYGHTYGVDPTGRPASPGKSVPMGAPKKPGQTNYGPGGTPLSGNLPSSGLPSGAMSADPNWGRMGLDTPTPPAASSVGGRFGGLRPSFEGPAQKIGYESPDYGNIISRTNSDYYSRMRNDDAALDGMRPDGSFTMGKDERGIARGVSRSLDGIDAFDVANPDMVDQYGNPYGGYEKNSRGETFDPNDATAKQRAVNQALIDTALRTQQPMGMFSGNDERGLNHVGHATDIHLIDAATGRWVEDERLPMGSTLTAAGARRYDNFADDVFDTVYQNPDVYRNVGPSMRYGGDFVTGDVPRDVMHYDTTPGGGFSGPQRERHAQAVARADQVPASGFSLASNRASAVAPGMISMSQPPAAPSEPGIYNGLKSIPGAISRLGQGIRSLSETLSTPMPATAKAFLGSVNSPNKLVSAGAKLAAGQVIGPAVKEAAASAISGLKNTFDPNNPRAQEAEAERRSGGSSSTTKKSGPTASGVREAQRGERRSETKTASAAKSGGNPDRGKGGDRENGNQKKTVETRSQKAKRIGRKKIEDLTKPEPKAADWSSYMNVMTKEQALRKLLGEEWDA